MNQAIHTVDLLQWLMGGVQDIKAFTSTLNHSIETEDTAAATFVYSNGALGTLTATTCAAQDYPTRIEIIGSEGRVTLESTHITDWVSDTPPESIVLTEEDHKLVDGWEKGEAWGLSHQRQLRVIFEQIAADTQPYVSGVEARKPVDVILSVYRDANG